MEIEDMIDLSDKLDGLTKKLDFVEMTLLSNMDHQTNSKEGLAIIIGEISDEIKTVSKSIH